MNSVTRQKKNINSGLEQNTFFCRYDRKEYKIDLNYAFIVLGPPCCFHEVEVHHFNRPKISNNSLIRDQKSNKHIANGFKKLVHVTKEGFCKCPEESFVFGRVSYSSLCGRESGGGGRLFEAGRLLTFLPLGWELIQGGR